MNYKIKIENMSHGRAILKKLFSDGIKFLHDDTSILGIDKFGYQFSDKRIWILLKESDFTSTELPECKLLQPEQRKFLLNYPEHIWVMNILSEGVYKVSQIEDLNDILKTAKIKRK